MAAQKGIVNPKTEMEPRVSRMGTDEERVMETKQGIRA
jgi:hypothetical protein